MLEHHEGEVVGPPVPSLAVSGVLGVAHTLDGDDYTALVRVISVHMVSAQERQPPQVAVVTRLVRVLAIKIIDKSKFIGNGKPISKRSTTDQPFHDGESSGKQRLSISW